MRLLTVEDEIRARVREEERAEGRNEGRREGRAEERRDLLSRLQESGMITADQAATAMGWSF